MVPSLRMAHRLGILARGEYPREGRDAEGEEDRDAKRDGQPHQGGGPADQDWAADHPHVAHSDDAGQAVPGPGRIGRSAGQEDLRNDARQACPEDREADDAAHRVIADQPARQPSPAGPARGPGNPTPPPPGLLLRGPPPSPAAATSPLARTSRTGPNRAASES